MMRALRFVCSFFSKEKEKKKEDEKEPLIILYLQEEAEAEAEAEADTNDNDVDVDNCLLGSIEETRGADWPDSHIHLDAYILTRISDEPLSVLTVHNFKKISLTSEVSLTKTLNLSVLAPNLVSLTITHCSLPRIYDTDLVLPPNLRILKLAYDCIEDFEVVLPRTLRVINLSYNKLRSIPACLEGIRDLVIRRDPDATLTPAHPHPTAAAAAAAAAAEETSIAAAITRSMCTLNMKNNNFWFSEYSDVTPGRVTRESMVELSRAHGWGLLSSVKLNRALSHLRSNQLRQQPLNIYVKVTQLRTTYDNTQSVHLTTIQSSVRDAIAAVVQASRVCMTKQANAPCFDVNFVKKLAKHMGLSGCALLAFELDCANHIPHTSYSITFGNLCEHLLRFVNAQPNAADIFWVMGTEYTHNASVCLTGKFTHILASLNGLVEGFAIGINRKEELANEMINVRNKWSTLSNDDFEAYIANAIPEAMQLLEDACIPEKEQGAWLDGI